MAAFLGNLVTSRVQLENIPLIHEKEAAYAAYENGILRRVVLINMRQYNYTINGTSSIPNPRSRPSRKYDIKVPKQVGAVAVQRLMANGSDAITGVTWDGYSFNHELSEGLPVRLWNITTGKLIKVRHGVVCIDVPDSSAALLKLL